MARSQSRRRGGQQSQALIYLRLARPHFLAGGFLLYALGAVIARHQHVPFDGRLYLTGQLFVTSLQLMTQFLNEYWDVDADRLNANRTWFSGGSGVLAAGQADRETTYKLAVFCLLGAFAAAIVLAVTPGFTLAAGAIVVIAGLGAWFYSGPPLPLASSGVGELTTSFMVAALLPAFAYSLQAGRISPLVWLTAAPLFMLHLAMLLAFELPDAPSDEAAQKRTLYVRLGKGRAVLLHRLALLAAYALLGLGAAGGVPLLVVLSGALAFPLALVQAATFPALATAVRDAGAKPPVPYGVLTISGVALFAVTAGLMTLGYWRAG